MINRYHFLSFAFCLGVSYLFGQCPPPGFEIPGNGCATAPIFCRSIDGFCTTINNNNIIQTFPGCPDNVLNNDEWIGFLAGSTSISIQVTPGNCQDILAYGLQGCLYSSCDTLVSPLARQCECTMEPFVLTANNLTIGQVYYLVIDGCSGDVCDYKIAVLNGLTETMEPGNPGTISGNATVCHGNTNDYLIPPVTAATSYHWTIDPPIGTLNLNDNEVFVTWSDTAVGSTNLCVSVSNSCYANPVKSCKTIHLLAEPTATISGPSSICAGASTNLSIHFTGEGPWRFTYRRNGVAQPFIQTLNNPYILPITQPGVYDLKSLLCFSPNCPGFGTVSGVVNVSQSLTISDWTVAIDQALCTSASLDLKYIVTNQGAVATTDSIPVSFYLGNPADSSARRLGVYKLVGPLAPGASASVQLTQLAPGWFPTGGMGAQLIYAVVNDNGMISHPFTTDSLSLYNLPECDYYNNFTSSIILLDTSKLDLGPDLIVCKDSVVVLHAGLDFAAYMWQDTSTFPVFMPDNSGTYWVEVTDICGLTQRDTIILTVLPYQTKSLEIAFCPGASVSIGGQVYTQPGTVVDTIASTGIGCDTIATYHLKWLPVPTKSIDIEFCPGNSVFLNGIIYTQPTTVLDTIPTSGAGCDTVVTYLLKYVSLPQPSTVDIQCPTGKTVVIPVGGTQTVVSYNTPTGSTDCPCGGASIQRSQGLASGVNFPVGLTKICYTASDSCGNSQSCCFNISVENEPDADPCDVKNTACIKFELLDILQNPARQKTYRMRVTNTCTNKLVYVAYQIPDGVVADKPLNNANYTAPSGRVYELRNPNYTPIYSIRFQSVAGGIANGQSDIFEYTLPPQADPIFIHAVARLEPQIFYETQLNIFNCPVQQTQNKPGDAVVIDRETSVQKTARIYPNPASDLLFVDLSAWKQETLHLKVTDALGRTLQDQPIEASADPLELHLPKSWAPGIYQLEVIPSVGEAQTLRFVIVR